MADIDTTDIRAVCDDGHGFNYRQTIYVLCDEVDRLRARLAEVEAERDDLDGRFENLAERAEGYLSRTEAVEAERDALASRAARIFERSAEPDPLLEENADLRARLAEVEALCDRYDAENNDLNDQVIGLTARLAEVETLIENPGGQIEEWRRELLAAARGEGDRPAEGGHEFVLRMPGDPFFPSACGRNEGGSLCGESFGHPIHSGEGDRG